MQANILPHIELKKKKQLQEYLRNLVRTLTEIASIKKGHRNNSKETVKHEEYSI